MAPLRLKAQLLPSSLVLLSANLTLSLHCKSSPEREASHKRHRHSTSTVEWSVQLHYATNNIIPIELASSNDDEMGYTKRQRFRTAFRSEFALPILVLLIPGIHPGSGDHPHLSHLKETTVKYCMIEMATMPWDIGKGCSMHAFDIDLKSRESMIF